MKKNLLISLRLTIVMIVICAGLYPMLIAGIGKAAPNGGKGKTVSVNGKVVGYENIGQKFTEDKYFWGRPSAVDYNAAGSAGSNKGPSNPDYLKIVQDRIDTFLVHNPGVKKGRSTCRPGYSKRQRIRSSYFSGSYLCTDKKNCCCSSAA